MANGSKVITSTFASTKEITFAIVGAGMSGLQLAKDLSKLGVIGVQIFEAGPDLGFEHIFLEYDSKYAHELWQLLRADESFHRPWISDSDPHYSGIAGLRRRLGGRSLYWHGVVLRLEPWVLGSSDWPLSVSRDLTQGSPTHPSFYDLQEQEVMIAPASLGSERLANVLQSLGYEEAKSVPSAVRYYQTREDDFRWAAYSPLDYWAEALQEEEGHDRNQLPSIACNTEVIKILTHNGKTLGLQVRDVGSGRITDVSCANVIVAASTLENDRLVMNALCVEGYDQYSSLTGLMDHLVLGFMYHVPLADIPQDWGSVHIPNFAFVPGTEQTRFNIFVSVTRSHLDVNAILVDVWAMCEQLPQDRNRVYLDTTLAEPVHKVHVDAGFSESDLQVLAQAQKALISLSNSFLTHFGVSASFSFPNIDASINGTEDFAQAFAKSLMDDAPLLNPTTYISPLGAGDHEAGTLSLGSVLTENGECKDLEGLYVVGPSMFPRSGAANPSLTTLALAKRLAYYLRRVT